MDYIHWNNALAEFFFNEENAEKEVFLFITKEDVINVGKRSLGLEGDNELIFSDYIAAIRRGIPGNSSNSDILDLALYSYQKWREKPKKINGIEIKYPLYVGYLVLFVLPLTEGILPELRVDAYYPRLQKFLDKYDLPSMPYQNEHLNWNDLWKDLEEWSILTMNTQLGYFELHPFSNKRWVYVGKPLSQSILPVHGIKYLPRLFEIAGLIPGDNIERKIFRNILLSYGREHLNLSDKIINEIRDPENELGQSIINIVNKKYYEWTGNTDQQYPNSESIKKGYTIAQLRLCIEGDKAKGYKLYYRLYTQLDYPEDLSFNYNNTIINCTLSGQGWSRPLSIKFTEDLELKDDLNKWKAKFPEKEVRLFINGKNYHLSGWVEISHMISSTMLLLAKKEKQTAIEEWGELFDESKNFQRLPDRDLPEGYVLYQIQAPPISHPDIPILQFKTNKQISIKGGIIVDVRKWLTGVLPEVELENGRGNETVFINYEGEDKNITLTRKDVDHPVWFLPQNIDLDRNFYVKVSGTKVKGDQLKNKIIGYQEKEKNLNENMLPFRDKFGQIFSPSNEKKFVKGSNLFTSESEERNFKLKQDQYYSQFFILLNQKSFKEDSIGNNSEIDYLNELLITYLTVKGKSQVKDYFEAFESVYQTRFTPEEIENHTLGLSQYKRWSLSYLDFMGLLDYEYSTNKIIVNPPQFIYIPSSKGKTVLLLGGRTPDLISKLRKEAMDNGLYFNVEPQDSSLSPFLLPSTINITGLNKQNGENVEKIFKDIANKHSIMFNPHKLPQFRLAEFSGDIDGYEAQLIQDQRFDDLGWNARIFDVNKLNFYPVRKDNIDKTYSLIEYKLNEYRFIHKIWINGYSYATNKNWGRYLILKKNNKQVIFNDRDKKIIVVPATLPLPRLISEAMTLFSGKAPKNKKLNINGLHTWFNVYENIPHIFAYNYFRKVGQTIQETKIDL